MPRGSDVAQTPTAKAVARMMSRQAQISRFVAGPPKLPAVRLHGDDFQLNREIAVEVPGAGLRCCRAI